jgi:hypothetical protein
MNERMNEVLKRATIMEKYKMNTHQQIENYIRALQANEYLVQLADEKKEKIPLRISYTPEQLIKAVGFLKLKNSQGYNVYCRPIGWQYVLLDDLKHEKLLELSYLMPALLMETSPQNFQAWLILSEIPQNRNEAKEICQELATLFDADVNSAEPDHVGRLVGFTNRKSKHKKANGFFPFVMLRKWEHRISTFHPKGGACAETTQKPVLSHQSHREIDQSRRDFGLVCGMIREGLTDSEILERLANLSKDLESRKGRNTEKYLKRTLSKARELVRN